MSCGLFLRAFLSPPTCPPASWPLTHTFASQSQAPTTSHRPVAAKNPTRQLERPQDWQPAPEPVIDESAW